MVPSAWAIRGLNFVFQRDNAPCHQAKVIKEWFKDIDISVLEWSPQSPDLNPIARCYRNRHEGLSSITMKDDLWKLLSEAWSKLHASRNPRELGRFHAFKNPSSSTSHTKY